MLVVESKYYNADTKELYLSKSGIENVSKECYGRIFVQSAEFEQKLGKDLCEFNHDELLQFLQYLNPKNTKNSSVNGGMIKRYINWAIEKGIKKNRVNYLKYVDLDWHEDRVMKNKPEVYIKDSTFGNFIDSFIDPQDLLVFRMLYEGVGGDGCSEILNLKKSDADHDNFKLTLTDNNGDKRTIQVSEFLMSLILIANRKSEYALKNGKPDNSNRRVYVDLVHNDYVIRNAKTNVLPERYYAPAEVHTIHRRFKMAQDSVCLQFGIVHFTPKTVASSGMLAMAKTSYIKYGRITPTIINQIARQFNVSTGVVKEHVNTANMKRIYGTK